jgi:hypothetical protein
MVWSGHTFHTLLTMIMLYRIMKFERLKAEQLHGSSSSTTEVSSKLHGWCGNPPAHIAMVTFMVVCFLFEMFGILKIRYHYSLDLYLAALITMLATTSNWITETVRCLYRPHIIERILEEQRQLRDKERVTAAAAGSPGASHRSCFPLRCLCAETEPAESDIPPRRPTESVPTEQKTTGGTATTARDTAIEIEPEIEPAPPRVTRNVHEAASPRPTVEVATARQAAFQPAPLPLSPRFIQPAEQPWPDKIAALEALRGSECALRYLSFPTQRAFEARLNQIGRY